MSSRKLQISTFYNDNGQTYESWEKKRMCDNYRWKPKKKKNMITENDTNESSKKYASENKSGV